MKIHLFENYFLLPSTYDDAFHNFIMENFSLMYGGEYYMDTDKVLSESEREKRIQLSKNLGQPFQLNFYICHDDEKIGWLYGNQTDYETFYLANAAIKEPYRGKGILTAAIPAVVKILVEKGFQKICSRHAATNNRVLVPAFRAGFVISGFEISDVDGIMVQLTYYTNQLRRKVADFRVGMQTLTPEIAKALGLTFPGKE